MDKQLSLFDYENIPDNSKDKKIKKLKEELAILQKRYNSLFESYKYWYYNYQELLKTPEKEMIKKLKKENEDLFDKKTSLGTDLNICQRKRKIYENNVCEKCEEKIGNIEYY